MSLPQQVIDFTSEHAANFPPEGYLSSWYFDAHVVNNVAYIQLLTWDKVIFKVRAEVIVNVADGEAFIEEFMMLCDQFLRIANQINYNID